MFLKYDLSLTNLAVFFVANFSATETKSICDIPSTDALDSQWVQRRVTTTDIDCIPQMSEHYVSREGVAFSVSSVIPVADSPHVGQHRTIHSKTHRFGIS